jgi:hypothetical protein
MVIRKAILISAGGKKEEKGYLPGADADVANYRKFLSDEVGGWWYSYEIKELRNPSKMELLSAIREAKTADYCFIAASGHGRHVQGRGIDETRFSCNQNEEVAVSDLNPGCARVTIIVDCCRNVTRLETFKEANFANVIAKYSQETHPSALAHRQLFERAVSQAERGCSYLFSCDLNEAAQETQRGGYYSQELLNTGYTWYQTAPKGSDSILDISDAHRGASGAVTRREPQQNPQSVLGRRNNWFPFAVHP